MRGDPASLVYTGASGTIPHPTLADARATFSRKREKGCREAFMAITYDDHAEFQIARRGIDKAWIEATLNGPDTVEISGRRRSALKCLPGRRVRRSVVTPVDDPNLVITATFDRTRPCA